METTYVGIDYALGKSNIDFVTGIRYGVIQHNDLGNAWYEESSPEYIYSCPKCEREVDYEDLDGYCPTCDHKFEDFDFEMIDPIGFYFKDDNYKAYQGYDDTDIFITASPYYTECQYCSPCAPGAGYITNSVKDGVKAYCFGHDWFEDGKAPYKVYSVKTEREIKPNGT